MAVGGSLLGELVEVMSYIAVGAFIVFRCELKNELPERLQIAEGVSWQ